MAIIEALTDFLAQQCHSDSQQYTKIGVAYSGGVDSHAILDALVNQVKPNLPIVAYHINHQLQDDAAKWAAHCQAQCQLLNIELTIIEVDAKAQAGESPEAKARQARYQALEACIANNELLLTGQHLDDQAETFLLQLMRGAGIHGLAAMPVIKAFGRGYLARPLLNCSREQILDYAKRQQLSWVEDPSNQDCSIPRNFIRAQILPKLKQHWPSASSQIANSAAYLAEQIDYEQEHNQLLLDKCLEHNSQYQALTGKPLAIDKLKQYQPSSQRAIIRHWFAVNGLPRPGKQKLNLIVDEIINAREDASPKLQFDSMFLMRYQNALYLVPTKVLNLDANQQALQINTDELLEQVALEPVVINLPNSPFQLEVMQKAGKGLMIDQSIEQLVIRTRAAGESCQVAGRAHSRSIKKLFNEYQVPTWLREHWPVIALSDAIIAVPELFECEGYQANQDQLGLTFKLLTKSIS